MKAEAKRSKEAQPSVPMGQRVQRSHRVVLGGAGLFADQRHHRPGAGDSVGLHGRHAPHWRSPDHEPHRLRCRRSFTNWHVPLWRNPHRQQVIIFKPPFAPDTPDYVKRVIGLPGDSVEIHDGSVWVNGHASRKLHYRTHRAYDLRQPFTVPPNCYFVMGDNRGNSYDSRFWGCVPRNDIIGTPVMIYMSLDVPPDAWEPGQIRERFFATRMRWCTPAWYAGNDCSGLFRFTVPNKIGVAAPRRRP